jgi:VWFA-related protein
MDTARRAGVSVYAIGPKKAFPGKEERRILRELSEETGGRAFFFAEIGEMADVFDSILEELRSRYLLAYQPSSSSSAAAYRVIRVEVDLKGARVRARRGYSVR